MISRHAFGAPCPCTRSASTTRPPRSKCASGWRSGRTLLGDALRDLTGGAARQGSGDPVDVQPHRGLLPRRRADEGRAVAGRLPRPLLGHAAPAPLHAAARQGRDARVPRGVAASTRWCSGEPQILGQLKQAVRVAESAGSLGLVLNRLFQRTFAVAKDVRTHTDIGSASISMAAASVKLAERIFPSIAEQKLLLIGAGEMIELAATHFAREAPEVDHRRQPDDGARRGAGRPLLPPAAITLARGARAARAVRHRRDVHGEHAADPRQGPDRARDPRATAPADVHRRPGGAARRRAARRARSTTSSSTASTTSPRS